MIKKERYIGTHMDTDSAPDKRDTTSYYKAYNLEVINNGRNLSISPIKTKGEFNGVITLETIIGDTVIDGILYLFEHKSAGTYPDNIYSVTKDGTMAFIVSSDFAWTSDMQLDVVGNKENQDIIKVYWADGVNQLRALNVAVLTPYADGTNADIVLPVNLEKPEVSIIPGGNLIAGKVQYAYSLFNLHESQSTVSPLSVPVSVSNDMVGGESGEIMPLSAQVEFNNIDTTFEYIRVYSIHYQEANQVPTITLIYEAKVTPTLLLIDDGNLFISEMTSEAFKFIGGILIVPETIASKDNRLFVANYKHTNFYVPYNTDTDPRVFGFAYQLVTPPAEPWAENDLANYQLPALNIVHNAVTFPQETWNNELPNPTGLANVVNTPIINSPEAYLLSAGKKTSGSNASRPYQLISGGDAETTWALAGAQATAGSNVTTYSTLSGAGGAGLYKVDINFDVVRNTGSGNINAGYVVELYSGNPGTLVTTVAVGGSNYSSDFSDVITIYTETLVFDNVRVTAQSDNADWTVTVNTWGYKQIEWYELNTVPIATPSDDAAYTNYDISATGINSDVDYLGGDTITINSVARTPSSIQYNVASQTANFIFTSPQAGLTPGTSYPSTYTLTTQGTRTPVNDSTNIVATIDFTSLPAAYKEYTVLAATASGTASFVLTSYNYTIDGSSFAVGTEILTLNFNNVLLAGSIPTGAYSDGISITSLISNGTKTPIDATQVLAEVPLTKSFPGYQLTTITSALASGTAYFPTIAASTYVYGIVGSSFDDPSDVLTIDCGTQASIGVIPAGAYSGVQVSLFSWGGMRTPDDVPQAVLEVEDISGTGTVYPTPADVPLTHDAINPDYSEFKYQADAVTVGYEGTNFRFTFDTFTTGIDKNTKSLKQGEVYRVGIVYRDQFSMRSPTTWMVDLKVPHYLIGTGVYLSVEFIGDPQVFKDLGVVSYQVVVVKREPKDRSISSPGFLVPSVDYIWSDTGLSATGYLNPYYTLKRLVGTSLNGGDILKDFTVNFDYEDTAGGTITNAMPNKNDQVQFFYSTDMEFIFDEMYPAEQVRILGMAAKPSVIVSGGETKITYFKDGGPESNYIFQDIIYQTYQAQIADMPVYYMSYSPHMSPWSVLSAFEVVMSHKFTSHSIPNPTDIGINDIKDLDAAVLLKTGESDGSQAKKASNNISINNAIFKNSGAGQMTSFAMKGANAMALYFSDPNWHVSSGGGGDYSIFEPAASVIAEIYLPLVELLRSVPNQYGGASYGAKQRNSYMLNGEIISIDDATANSHMIGDVYIGPLIINRIDGLNTQKQAYWDLYEYVSVLDLEHNVDVYSRYDNMYTWEQGLDASTAYGLYRIDDNHQLLGAYNQQNTLILSEAVPETFDIVEYFDASIIASKQKYPNEVIDSWTDFLVNDVMDLQGVYGPINKLYNFTNELFAFQSQAVAGLMINPRVQLQADDGIGVELGTGTVLYNYKYLTTQSGTTHKKAITDDDMAIYYYDDVSKSINVHSGEELSTAKKVQNLMQTTIADTAVRAVFDDGKKDIIFVFDNMSIVYNQYIGEFIRTEDTHDYIHTFNNKVYSLVTSNLYEHYLGTDYEASEISYIFAPMPTHDKVFHNLEYRHVGSNNFNYIEAKDTLGRVGFINDPIINNKFNINRIHLPRVNNELGRFRDVNILVTLRSAESVDSMFIDDMVIMYNIKG